jgi:REP element-mobilizing transposase RayT
MSKLAAFLEQEIRRLCEANTWTIGALNVQPDHVHLFHSAPPSLTPLHAGVKWNLPEFLAIWSAI